MPQEPPGDRDTLNFILTVLGETEGTFYQDGGLINQEDRYAATQLQIGHSGLSFGVTQLDVANSKWAKNLFNELLDDAVAAARIDSITADNWKKWAAIGYGSEGYHTFTAQERSDIETKVLQPGFDKIDEADLGQAQRVLDSIGRVQKAVQDAGHGLGVLDSDNPDYEKAIAYLAGAKNNQGNLLAALHDLSNLGHAPTLQDVIDTLTASGWTRFAEADNGVETYHLIPDMFDVLAWPGDYVLITPIENFLDRPAGGDDDDGDTTDVPWMDDGVIQKVHSATEKVSPLVLDIDGDGVELSSLHSSGSVYFDFNNTGFAQAGGWISGGDGFLARDLNGDGFINNGSELFGNSTGYDNGFLALAQYDTNQDGQITSADQDWYSLLVWIDANQNGYSEAEELHPLDDLGITSVSLAYSDVSYQISDNDIKQESSFTIAGNIHDIVDVYFAASSVNTVYDAYYTLDPFALTLPTLRGYGNLPDLNIALSLDNDLENPDSLMSLVYAFSQVSFDQLFTDDSTIPDQVRAIMYRWAGVEDINAASRGPSVDAQELGFLEALTGQPFLQNGIFYEPHFHAGQDLNEAFQYAFNHFIAALIVQGEGSQLFEGSPFYTSATDSFAGITGLNLDTLDVLATEANGLSTAAEKQTFWANVLRVVEYAYGTDNLTTTESDALEDAINASDASLHLAGIVDGLIDHGPIWTTIVGTSGDDTLAGTSGNDSMFGLNGNDTIDGGQGSDIIDAGSGNNTIAGGLGNDLLLGGSGNDVFIHNAGDGTDNIVSGGGSDKIVLGPNIDASNLTFTRIGNSAMAIDIDNGVNTPSHLIVNTQFDSQAITTIEFADASTIDPTAWNWLTYGTVFNDRLDGVTYAGGANDTIYAGAGNDTVFAGTGTDTVYGEAGNDYLDGGTGADTLTGGAGNDTYIVDNAGDVVVESSGEGTDTVKASISYTLAANVENLILSTLGVINGTGNTMDNVITGNGFVNVLTGGAGNDTINGYAGNDTLIGGTGDDTYIVNNTGVTITENSGEGTDTVKSSLSTYTLGSNLENLILTGNGNITGIGNTLDNVITGTIGNNTLNGGTGADSLVGGKGNDVYIVDNAADVVIENPNEGTDEVQSSATYTLSANVEKLTLTGSSAINGTGNEIDNIITGNSGVNTLDGGAGNDTIDGGASADTMIGGTGDDTFMVNVITDVVQENSGEGTDTVIASVGSYVLADNVEKLILGGSVAIGYGNSSDNVIIGNTNANTMEGRDGDDTIDGGTGSDRMIGGLGNDTYYVDATGDTAIENSGEGTDLVISTASSYTLGANVENLILAGTGNINGTGNADVNIITGNSGNNTLNGGAGADTLIGGLGDDTYVIDDAGDLIVENADEGIDTVQTGLNNYVLDSNFENLTLTGASVLTGTGNALDNVMTSNTAASTLIGGAGDDTYVITNGSSVIIENSDEGIDTVLFGSTTAAASYTLAANVENLTLTGTATLKGFGNTLDNVMNGNSVANTLDGGAGNDTLWGGTAGTDTLIGGSGDDVFIVDRASGITLIEANGGGNDTVMAGVTHTLSSTQEIENLTLTGTGNINGTGNTLDNVITGNSGNNTLDGGAGADTLSGGDGNDLYIVDNAGDAVIENADEGTDTVQSSVSYALSANVENLTLTGAAVLTGTGNSLDNTLTGNSAASSLAGGAGNDTYVITNASTSITENADQGIDTVQFTGTAGTSYTLTSNVENLTLAGAATTKGFGNELDNVITGNSVANTLTGGDGNDTLDGGGGADTMIGGAGNDTYYVGVSTDVIIENLDEGADTVHSIVTYTLGANLENLILDGASAISGTGNALDNILTGNTAANSLNGMAGADTMIGGAGNDTYFVDDAGDLVTENASEGTDTVQSSISYTLTANVENLTLTGSANVNATGNSLNNTLTGNTGDNILDGGTGADAMNGGTGNDTYYVDNAGDTVTESSSTGGTDLVYASVSFTLGANVENLTLTGTGNINGTGNTLVNVITGNSGDNTLNGGSGADTLIGGAGNDLYIVDNALDVVTENADEGADTVQSSVTWALADNFENLTLTGASLINGTGNGGDNIITGNSVKNILTGGGGNDTIDGGGGADTMIGGTGDDLYIVSATTMVVQENTGEGFDEIQSSVTYTIAANVEKLTLTGSGNINATGDSNSNILVGNAGNNTLNGMAGADTMIGGAGDDLYIVDDAGDVVTELNNGGSDSVQSSISYTLANYVESLTLTGSGNIDGTGTNTVFKNFITGNSGVNILTGGTTAQNVLDGGSGADTMIGGFNWDTYYVDNAGDVITESSPFGGTDLVNSSITYTLGSNLENLTLTGTSAINGTGNALNNVITGNSGVNTLDGGDGNDTLDGGTGNDRLIGGLGNDTFYIDSTSDVVVENANEGTDLVFASLAFGVTYTLGADVENLTLTGANASNGTGNALNNVIVGNSATNQLRGMDGDDILDDGGAGSDTMIGGNGNDTYYISDALCTVTESSGVGTGIDTVILRSNFASASYTLTANVENLTFQTSGAVNGTGNTLDNIIIGGSGNNTLSGGSGGNDTIYGMGGNDSLIGGSGNDTLDGGTGADTMNGGGGNDLFIVDNAGDVVIASTGIDLIQSSVSYTLATNAENLTLTGSGNINGTGNTLDNLITGNSGNNSLSGADGNDTLIGGPGNDTLNGGNGNDLLKGGDGLDVLTGGAGADTFYFDNATAWNNRDVIKDFATAQADKIDIHDLLSTYNPLSDALADFVKFDNALNGTDSIMSVDRDGTGGSYGWQQVAILSEVRDIAAVDTLVANGNLVVS
jgi:Ca2+-binding RTX toxin-like protein